MIPQIRGRFANTLDRPAEMSSRAQAFPFSYLRDVDSSSIRLFFPLPA